MLSINVKKEASNQKLIKFVEKVLPYAPKNFVYKLFRKKDVKVNGKWQKEDYIIFENDKIDIYITENQLKDFRVKDSCKYNSDLSIPILYENENVLFMNKPLGVLSQKVHKTDASVNDFVISYLKYEDGFKPSIVNRLDRNTSGIICAGKNYNALRELSNIFRYKKIRKIYTTIVKGHINHIIHDIAKISREGMKSEISENGKGIETKITPIKYINGYTICEVEIFTGRTHQIRAHMSYLGYPILGDTKYGDKNKNIKHHILHCSKLYLEKNEVLNLKNICIEAELPKYIRDVIKRIENGNMGN